MGNRKSRLKSQHRPKIIYQTRKTIIKEDPMNPMVLLKQKHPDYAKKNIALFLIKDEYEKLWMLQPHPNIIEIYGFTDDSIKMKKYESNLWNWIKKHDSISIELILMICYDVMKGLYHIHKNGIIHRDIKPENILVDKNRFIICDFDSSAFIKENTYDLTETYTYVAPEVVDGKMYDKMIDYWSLGAVLFEIETCYPFRIMDSVNIFRQFTDVRPELVPLLRDLLSKDSWRRPTYHDLKKYPIFWKIQEKIDI